MPALWCLVALVLPAPLARAAMPTAGERRGFREDGWVQTWGALGAADVESLGRALRGVFANHSRRAFAAGAEGKEVRFTFAVHELDATAGAFIASGGALWRAAASMAGRPGQDLCVLMDRGFSKDPGDSETHWHRDDRAIGLPDLHPELRTVHAWIPLAPVTPAMGTLRYLAGSHRRGGRRWLLAAAERLWGADLAAWMLLPQVQDAAMRPGDVAWHDGWVVHSAAPNEAGAVRDGFAVSFAYCGGPSDCGGAARRAGPEDATCRGARQLFGAEWLARHRAGEDDYDRTLVEDPWWERCQRFALRSVVGGLGGLGAHALLSRLPWLSRHPKAD